MPNKKRVNMMGLTSRFFERLSKLSSFLFVAFDQINTTEYQVVQLQNKFWILEITQRYR